MNKKAKALFAAEFIALSVCGLVYEYTQPITFMCLVLVIMILIY